MIYLDSPITETRATINRLMAALEGFVDWMLGRQHESDCVWSLGPLPRLTTGESNNEGVQR